MTVDQFIATIPQTIPHYQWYCEDTKYLPIRSYNGILFCPLTALCNLKTHRLYRISQYNNAATHLELSYEDAQIISSSIDGRMNLIWFSQQVRDAIVAALSPKEIRKPLPQPWEPIT